MSALIIILLMIQSSIIIADDPCRFESVKGVIDLTSIARNDGRAAYQDTVIPTGSLYTYSYNPCRPFSEGIACQNVAACQVSANGSYTYPLGTHDTITWNDGSSFGIDPSVTYKYQGKTVRVTLECAGSQPAFFETLGETTLNTFVFRLRHMCACWDGCKFPPTTTTEAPHTTTGTTNKTSTSTTTKTTTPTTTTTTITTTTQASTAGDRMIISKGMVLFVILGLVYSNVFFTY